MQLRCIIAGHRWTVRFVRSITHEGISCDGLCDYEKREIRIRSDLRGKALADTLLHEGMHAAGWHLHEEFVAQTATDLAGVLDHPKIRDRIYGESQT